MPTLTQDQQLEQNRRIRKQRIVGGAQLASGGALLTRSARSGLPRALGVQLETHSTNKKAAKNILANGLDPFYKKAGSKGVSGFKGAMKTATREERRKIARVALASKNKVFITGFHPDQNVNGVSASIRKKGIRNLYRGLGTSGAKEWDAIGRWDASIGNKLRKGQVGQALKTTGKTLRSPGEAKLAAKIGLKSLPGVNAIKSRSLYHGGSTRYFRENFQADPGLPGAMMSGKKLKLAGTRAGATLDAINREGLRNLISDDPTRVAVGLGVTLAGGLGAGYLANKGIRNLKNEPPKKGRPKKLTKEHRANISKALKGRKKSRRPSRRRRR